MTELLRQRLALQGFLIIASQLLLLRYAIDADGLADNVVALCSLFIIAIIGVTTVHDLRVLAERRKERHG